MIYDWRHSAAEPVNRRAEIFDADTGEKVQFVFFIDTDTNTVGRWLTNEIGRLYVVWNEAEKRREAAHVFESRRVRIEWGEPWELESK